MDGGVAYHSDLSNITRVNVWGGSSPVVGCYAHATQVAGIINATAGNSGTVGVLPGVPLVSASFARYYWQDGSLRCSDPQFNSEDLAQALDYVYWDIRNNNGGKPGIVNMSVNNTDMGISETVGAKMKTLATPDVGSGYVYFGGFIAQSAGNNNASACNYAYNDSNSAQTNDGIMVVGGVDRYGEDVAGTGAYVSDWASTVDGSNYGACVDVWAPSKEIYGAWGQKSNPIQSWNSATWTVESTTYSSAAKSGGTSLAAPHIAAIAAHLQKNSSLASSVAIETAVRNTLYTANKTDQGSNTIYYAIVP